MQGPQLPRRAEWSVEPGETFMALWGTGYDKGRASWRSSAGGKVLQACWTDPDAPRR